VAQRTGGDDQWISATGTSWAIMALSLAAPAQEELSTMFRGL